jgi:hypothetical protein
MRLWLCGALTLAILATVSSAAQEQPDLSGQWVRVQPPHDSATVLTVVQNERFITIEQIFPVPRSGTYQVGVAGGVAGALGGGPTWSRQWSAVWKDATLVITQQESLVGTGEPQIQSKHEEVWSMDSEGRLVVVITDQKAGAAATTTRFVYRRSR